MKKIIALIVFLFLIIGMIFFFAIKDIIAVDKGITAMLPPPPPPTSALGSGASIKPRNVLTIFVKEDGIILIRKERVAIEEVTDMVKDFIMNPDQNKNLARSPSHAIISLKNRKETPYKKYLKVYNEVKRAYNELWEEEANKKFNKPYNKLKSVERREIRKTIPLIVSDEDPDDID